MIEAVHDVSHLTAIDFRVHFFSFAAFGFAAHRRRSNEGFDAVAQFGLFLYELGQQSQQLFAVKLAHQLGWRWASDKLLRLIRIG